ncbi:hypothetical protein GJAV_G00269380 [Gymnothorax javanicus]|nr:hypothetical protein GJAV_G00269380 [Gymnothorax javanicus]
MSSSDWPTDDHDRRISKFFRSEIFIAIMVVLILICLAVLVFCCIYRRRRTQKLRIQKLTEIVVISGESEKQGDRPKFKVRILTDQHHATKLVRIITAYPHRKRSEEAPLQRSPSCDSRLEPDLAIKQADPVSAERCLGASNNLIEKEESPQGVTMPLVHHNPEDTAFKSFRDQPVDGTHSLEASKSAPAVSQ